MYLLNSTWDPLFQLQTVSFVNAADISWGQGLSKGIMETWRLPGSGPCWGLGDKRREGLILPSHRVFPVFFLASISPGGGGGVHPSLAVWGAGSVSFSKSTLGKWKTLPVPWHGPDPNMSLHRCYYLFLKLWETSVTGHSVSCQFSLSNILIYTQGLYFCIYNITFLKICPGH